MCQLSGRKSFVRYVPSVRARFRRTTGLLPCWVRPPAPRPGGLHKLREAHRFTLALRSKPEARYERGP
jgi:hypothetical protein